MIRLHQFPKNRQTINFSPFCLKLETYLRMAKVPYESVKCLNPRTAPKGKLPFIEDKGQRIADSGLIIEHLKRTLGDPLDAGLSPEQKASGLALTRLLEGDLIFVLLYSRWSDEPGWAVTRRTFFKGLPAPLKLIVPPLAAKKTRKRIQYQGMGLHSRDEIYAMGAADLEALSALLGDKPYFMGDRVSSVDATAYGFLKNICFDVVDSPLKTAGRSHHNLLAFCDRITKAYFPDSPTAA